MSKNTVIAVVGPTASGKTKLAIEIARRLPGEIVACDSRTVYRHMDVGTAKPTLKERGGVPHFMFDVIDPDKRYTVAEYKQSASRYIDEIHQRGNIPIVCGGTGFYARALLEGLVIPEVAPQKELREELKQFADANGNLSLFQRLHEVDSVTAERLNPNDRFRVIRALEVSLVTGIPFSQLKSQVESPFNVVWIGLNCADRSLLRTLIAQRFEEQLENGLIAEVQSLYKMYGQSAVLGSTVNYQEFLAYIDGQRSYQDSIQECLKHNNQLARRQLIWFRANQKITWFEIDRCQTNQLIDDVLRTIDQRTN